MTWKRQARRWKTLSIEAFLSNRLPNIRRLPASSRLLQYEIAHRWASRDAGPPTVPAPGGRGWVRARVQQVGHPYQVEAGG
jgi:hypothetical protein